MSIRVLGLLTFKKAEKCVSGAMLMKTQDSTEFEEMY